MFTGIVEELGTIGDLGAESITIRANTVLDGTIIGDSIAVNGVCLTVTALGPDFFEVGVVPETWRRTNLGDQSVGSPVNLERSLAANGRIGGHFVQGHVDGTGRIDSITPEGNGVIVKFSVPPEIGHYLVNKGFVCVDGCSLTIVEAGPDWFTLTLIPHTRDVTTFGVRTIGDRVNLEVDILGKYVERFVGKAV